MTIQIIFRRLVLVAGVAAVCSTLGGCAYLQVGEEDFSCSGMPDSVFCRSTRDVYDATGDGVVPSPMTKESAYNDDCVDCQKSHLDRDSSLPEKDQKGRASASSSVSAEEADEVIANYVTVALPERPVPIRTPSQVMRIWVSPFIDTNGDYNAPGYIYTEIEPRRWVLAKERENIDRVMTPLLQQPDVAVSKQMAPQSASSETTTVGSR